MPRSASTTRVRDSLLMVQAAIVVGEFLVLTTVDLLDPIDSGVHGDQSVVHCGERLVQARAFWDADDVQDSAAPTLLVNAVAEYGDLMVNGARDDAAIRVQYRAVRERDVGTHADRVSIPDLASGPVLVAWVWFTHRRRRRRDDPTILWGDGGLRVLRAARIEVPQDLLDFSRAGAACLFQLIIRRTRLRVAQLCDHRDAHRMDRGRVRDHDATLRLRLRRRTEADKRENRETCKLDVFHGRTSFPVAVSGYC